MVTIVYQDDADKLSAELIQKKHGGTIYKYNPNNATLLLDMIVNSDETIIVIGGDHAGSYDSYQACETLGDCDLNFYGILIQNTVMPEVPNDGKGHIFVNKGIYPSTIIACVGWLREETISSAMFLYQQDNLPDSNIQNIEVSEEFYFSSLKVYGLPNNVQLALNNFVSKSTDWLNDHKYTQYKCLIATYNPTEQKLEVLFSKPIGAGLIAPLLAVVIIALCIAIVAIVVGFIIDDIYDFKELVETNEFKISVKQQAVEEQKYWADLLKNTDPTDPSYPSIKNAFDKATDNVNKINEGISNGFIIPEDKGLLGELEDSIIKIVVIAGVAIVGYKVIEYMVEQSKKPKPQVVEVKANGK